MSYYTFNIGLPATTAWWQQNLSRKIITAGYDGESGDRGERILNRLNEGDWVLAYCNSVGFIGAGRVLGIDTYRLHPNIPLNSLSDHQHERGVRWGPHLRDTSEGISSSEVGTHTPRQTMERIDSQLGERIVALLTERALENSDKVSRFPMSWKYLRVPEAIGRLGGASTIREITEWLEVHYPNENHSDARENARLLTVNDVSRRHHDRGRKNFRTDTGNPKDVLFRTGVNKGVRYEKYIPSRHGIWDVKPSPSGDWAAIQVIALTSELDRAMLDARQQVSFDFAPPIDSDHDGRVWVLRSVALREGQSDFRAALLSAYGKKCAVTGCPVVEILEAAHIRPYRGDYTHRVDNGLLLRADIHTLFDKGMIWIDDQHTVQIDERLTGSDYANLQGRKLHMPENSAEHPHPDHLAEHRRYAGRGNKPRVHP
ncbi:Endonuclease NucS [Pandoraea communis]|uniref:Endonuclease NucS n=2 Tax=Pandoraea communis TaxID=2508297 RepID=A0A5E4XXD7_9BURK|nr:Endonuclease NucS [Pandoraea communis]